MKILITMGLPASGKTTWAKQYKKSNWSTEIHDVDKITIENQETNINKILNIKKYKNAKTVIIDGLFLTNQDVIAVINEVKQYSDVFEIHYWEEDREQCLINDTGRRSKSSRTTIKESEFEKVNLNEIKKGTGLNKVTVVNHKVYTKPEYIEFAEQNGVYLSNGQYLHSENWSLGGTRCGWDGGRYEVGHEPQPTAFVEFDELLEKVCPQITFMQYKAIYNKCVTIDSCNDRDYYGGCVEYARFECNIEILYKELKNRNLIQKEG